jgi:8-oxo-dGTP diphosphatase
MTPAPKFCSQCGQAVTVRRIMDRDRAVCDACDEIFYENPLPVAAAVVLNERREVLLVRRKNPPHQGSWCLPMGFAERGETIGDAALRELKEETGIDGRVMRLVDTDSMSSSHYGDLLIVTFEVAKIRGIEEPGDDAEAVQYFPLNQHPPLAFDANEKSLRACVAAHLEAWAIQDSFVTLQADEDKALLSDALVELIQDRADEIVQLWVDDVCTNPTTQAYRELSREELAQRAKTVIHHFGDWFKSGETAEESRDYYRQVGRVRREEGVAVHEVLSALALLKKHVWQFARAQGIWARPIDVYRVLELNRLMAVFFDKAAYNVARGFDSEGA